MATSRAQRVGELLVKAKVIDPLQLRSALAQHDAWGGRLAHVVVEMGLAEEEVVVEHLARALSVQRARLGNLQKDPQALAKVDLAFAEERGVFPMGLRDAGKVLLLAMADPSDLETVDEVTRRVRTRVTPYIAGEGEIRAAIARHYRGVAASGQRRTTTRSMPAAHAPGEAPNESEEEEFKLIDMSGKTVMKPLSAIDPRLAQTERGPAEDRSAPPVASSGPGVAQLGGGGGGGGMSASDLLDDIMGGAGGPVAFSEEQLQRLHTVQLNQEKSGKIIRAVMELLLEKGALTREGLQEKLRG